MESSTMVQPTFCYCDHRAPSDHWQSWVWPAIGFPSLSSGPRVAMRGLKGRTTMKTQAAILWNQGQPWSIEEIDLDPPEDGEVLIELSASGMCHSDDHMVTGDMVLDPETAEMLGVKQFPMVGGHEGAGVVLDVGQGVTRVAPGDHVVL